MGFLMYAGIGYLILINIIGLAMYVKNAEVPCPRLSAAGLILVPVLGGSLGAAIANYFCNTASHEQRWKVSFYLTFVPPFMFIVQFIAIVYWIGIDNCFMFLWNHAYARAGVLGYYLVLINVLSFILVVIRKSAYYFAPYGNDLIPDLILMPLLIFGGATGGSISKVLFNFKEDWSCNATKVAQNFVYNTGMFILSAIHIGLFVYFFYMA